MINIAPLLLQEAVLSLWQASPDGTALLEAPVFVGAPANQLNLEEGVTEVLRAASGDLYRRAYHVDEEHVIQIRRTFVLRTKDQAVVRMERNRTYVLDIVWSSARGRYLNWHRRTYFGVTWRSHHLTSEGAQESVQPQVFRAQYYTPTSGQEIGPPGGGSNPTPPPIYTPVPPSTTGEAVPVGFFREAPLVVSEYLIGVYRWPVAMVATFASAISGMPWGAPCVLVLEVGGVETAALLTLPTGPLGFPGPFPLEETVEAESTFSVPIPAGASVRWKIRSGPAPENAAGNCAVSLLVQPV